ncbi:MAG: hypothetical protein A4E65_01211 [Syntrophorhabdus sp. PtaU1.Bin153]|nr:MAG: hypothetical protein A4E65_01211 [Syntrophorhabdus sp. PtaU1.Bin153]
MSVVLAQDEDNVKVLLVAGILKKFGFDAVIKPEAEQWGRQTRMKLPVLAESNWSYCGKWHLPVRGRKGKGGGATGAQDGDT